MIFGIESICYMDTPEKMDGFAQSCSALLKQGGNLVIIDGFRSSDFDKCGP